MQSNAELVSSIKINGAVPENQADFSDESILALADEVMQQTLLPVILSAKEEYFVFEQRFPIVAGKKKYRIPSRAIGATLRDVLLERGTSISSVNQMNAEDIQSSSQGTPSSFYLEANSVCLYPTPSISDGVLNLKYFIRPAMLTPVTNASRVTSIDTATNTITLQAMPAIFGPTPIVDFTKGTAHYEPLSLAHAVSAIVGTSLQLPTLPLDLEIGDWVSLSGYSPVPSIPEDYHGVLSLLTASKILQSLGQSDQEAVLIQKAETSLARLGSALSPRVVGEPKKYVSPLF